MSEAKFREYTVQSEAFLTDGGMGAGVFLEGFSGYVCLDHLELINGSN
jgi:hypothetical protein